jgi:UDP-perosamine 4-acetyltransferase
VRVVVYGSRPDGHARVVIDLLLAGGEFEVLGLIDDHPENAHRRIGGVAVVGDREDLASLAARGLEGLVLGFGDARGRGDAIAAAEDAELAIPRLVHSSAFVADQASLGAGCQVLPNASIAPGARIGRGVLVNTGAIVEHDVVVADYAVIGPGAVLAGRSSVGEAGHVGAGAVLLPDVVVSAKAVVGAGAVVTSHVSPGRTVVGVPARERTGAQTT